LSGIHAQKPGSNVSTSYELQKETLYFDNRSDPYAMTWILNKPGGFLDGLSGKIQWGFVPNLWPQGTVERLDNWGWQIHNPNVVLRSIDQVSTSLFLEPRDCETTSDDIERVCSKNHGGADSSDNNIMWKDLLDSLENVPLSASPLVNGAVIVTAEIPRGLVVYE
jgi:hypothetical protein